MAGRRVYGGSDMAVLLQNEGISPETFEAILASSSSNGGFHGSRSMVNFGNFCGNTLNQPFYQSLEVEETGDEDLDECLHQPEKKRRLTADQVQFLERSFEVENKLEPERKIQLAKDLGLQPRQVAIWFQNRRARWKTKQLEMDYEVLKSSYNILKADYDNLIKEKEKLKAEVIHLTDKLLLKEKEKGITEAIELNKSPTYDSVSIVKNSETPVIGWKQEELSSANSAILDSESSHCNNEVAPTDSLNAFEPDQSDLSQVEEEEEVKGCQLLKFEDNPGVFGFPMEDQACWFWPY